MKELFDHLVRYRRLRSFNALGARTPAAAQTYLRHFIADISGRNDGSPGWDNVAGFRIRHLGATWMRYVYREVFAQREYWFHTTNPRPHILDCGGNIGMSTLLFKALYPDAVVDIFEPAPWACDAIRETIRANALGGVTVHGVALAEHDGTLDLFHDTSEPGSAVMSVHRAAELRSSTQVPARRLSSYVTGPIDYLKLDVEGSEMAVLRDLDATGKLSFIEQIGMEFHHHLNPVADELGACLSLLERNEFGYQLKGQVYTPITRGQFQGLMIHAYRKPSQAAVPQQ